MKLCYISLIWSWLCIEKRNKELNEVKLVENINKKYQNFQEKDHMQKEVSPLCKLLEHVYE